jgi:hypothetical protein
LALCRPIGELGDHSTESPAVEWLGEIGLEPRTYVRTVWSARVFIRVDDDESIAKQLIQ